MKKLKKGLKVLPKKILSLFLAIATLFTNFIPLTTVFAITEEEKADLVEIKLRRAKDIEINGNTATITYNGGTVTVNGNNLQAEKDDAYDYGNDVGTICYLYTTNSTITFTTYPEENHTAGYWYDGRPENLQGNEYTMNDLKTYSLIHEGYDIEFFFKNIGDDDDPVNDGLYEVNFGTADWHFGDDIVEASISNMVLNDGPVKINDATIIHLEGFNHETMKVLVHGNDGFGARLNVDENSNTSLSWVADNSIHLPPVLTFSIVMSDDDEHHDKNPDQDGNTTAIVRIWGADGTYEEGGDEHPYNGPGEVWSETRFNINDGAIYMFLPEGEKIDGDQFLYNEIEYKYDEETNDTHISLGMYLPIYANRKFTSITINGTPYPIPLDFSDRDDWLTHIVDSYVGFTLNVPKANNNIYEIEVKIDPSYGLFIGRFRWTNAPTAEFISDEHGPILNEFGEPIKNDDYIPHVNIELLEVSFNVAGHEYVYTEENFQNDHFDGEYISYNLENHLGFKLLNVDFPSETIFKIRITPDYGYQIVAIHTPVDGIYTKGENAGEFIIDSSHMLHESDFSVEIGPGEDTVQIETNAITEADITLPNNTISNGNINLIVDDIEPTPEEVSRFENYANGYEIKKYLNIHLDQVFFNGNALEPVFVHIDNLNNKATISLKLVEGIDGDKIVILHDINNSGTMELIEIDSYDKNTNVITFKVDSFSNFAIASKTYTEITDISISLEAPLSGQKINVSPVHNDEYDFYYNVPDKRPTAMTDSNEFTINATEWVNGTCNGGSIKCDELFNGTFQTGDDYYAKIYISSNEGYKLTLKSLENVTVNGRTLSSAVDDEFFNVYGTEDETNTMFIVKIKAESAPVPELKGDMNQNGKIDLQDIIYLLKKYLGVEETTEEDINLGDMDNNGSLGLKDIILLLKSYLGVE